MRPLIRKSTALCVCVSGPGDRSVGAKAEIPHQTGKDQTRCSMEVDPPS